MSVIFFSGRKVQVTLSLQAHWAEETVTSSKIHDIVRSARRSRWRRQELDFQNASAAGKGCLVFSPRLTQTLVSWRAVTEQRGAARNEASCRQSQTGSSEDAVSFSFFWNRPGTNTWSCVHGTQNELRQDESTQHLSALRQSFHLAVTPYPFQAFDSSSQAQAVTAELHH